MKKYIIFLFFSKKNLIIFNTNSDKLIANLKLIGNDFMNINASVNQLFNVMTKYYMKRFIQYYNEM